MIVQNRGNLVEYVFLVTFFLVLGIAAFIRIRHPFWSVQPVFHTYDFWRYWVAYPYVISPGEAATATKFLNHRVVKTKEYLDATDEEQARILDIIQCHYLRSDRILYTLTADDLRVQCSSHVSAPSIVSLYYTDHYIQADDVSFGSQEKRSLTNKPDMNGVLISYPVRFAFRGLPSLETVFFWEYIVVHREKDRDPMPARTLIQTHEANQRRMYGTDLPASLFRKDVDLSEGIQPFLQFTVSRFELVPGRIGKPPLAPHCTVTRIQRDKMHVLIDFLFDMTTATALATAVPMDVYLFPEMPALQARIESNKWLAYTMQSRDRLLAVYVFKNTRVQHDDDGVEMELMSAQSLTEDKAFFAGWLHAMHDILSIHPEIGFITMSNVSHNHKIIETWKWKYGPCSTHDAAFYFYNYVCPTKLPSQCWITL